MLKTLLGVVVELIVAAAIAGFALAVAVPLLTRAELVGANDISTRLVVTGVLVAAAAIALFRPGSAIRRHARR
jgi:hypothetical protein